MFGPQFVNQTAPDKDQIRDRLGPVRAAPERPNLPRHFDRYLAYPGWLSCRTWRGCGYDDDDAALAAVPKPNMPKLGLSKNRMNARPNKAEHEGRVRHKLSPKSP